MTKRWSATASGDGLTKRLASKAARREFQPRQAAAEAQDARAWICCTCDTMTEPGERYCRHCKIYWEDVDKGDLFYE